jgi:hypothetical protein
VLILVVTEGPNAGARYEVTGELVLGRENVDVILEDDEVSRRHAAVRPVEGALEVEDLGSTNGTFVDDVAIDAPARIPAGGSFRIGNLTLTVESESPKTAVAAREPEGAPPAEPPVAPPSEPSPAAPLAPQPTEPIAAAPPPPPPPPAYAPPPPGAPPYQPVPAGGAQGTRWRRLVLTLVGAALMAGAVFGDWFDGLPGVELPAVFVFTGDASLSFVEAFESVGLIFWPLALLAVIGLLPRSGVLTSLAGGLGIAFVILLFVQVFRIGGDFASTRPFLYFELGGSILTLVAGFLDRRRGPY